MSSDSDTPPAHKDTPQGAAALAFARALVEGDYARAHKMLAVSVQTKLSEAQLKDLYEDMVEYGSSEPNIVEATFTLDDWPHKAPDEIGWAYVAIAGDDFAEGITIILSNEDGREGIRLVEWGHP